MHRKPYRPYRAVLLLIAAVYFSGCAKNSFFAWNKIPQNPTRQEYQRQLSLARLSERHGQLEQARQIYNIILKKDPANRLCFHRLGVMSSKEGQLVQGEGLLRRAVAIGPPSAEILCDLAYNLYLQDRMEEAEKLLRTAVEKDRAYKPAHVNLALVLGEQGRIDESLHEFRQVVSEAEAQANIAYLHVMSGDLAQANATYHQALALDPQLKTAAEALVQLAGFQPSRPPQFVPPTEVQQPHQGPSQPTVAFAPHAARQPQADLTQKTSAGPIQVGAPATQAQSPVQLAVAENYTSLINVPPKGPASTQSTGGPSNGLAPVISGSSVRQVGLQIPASDATSGAAKAPLAPKDFGGNHQPWQSPTWSPHLGQPIR